ncbi:MAG: AAA family ATPase, partial [Acidimicrobiales bacterium]
MPVAVRTGAADLVYLPAGDEEMARAVGRGLEVGSRVREDRLNLTEKDPKLANPGTVITVASATGGCGKTFLATNLAAWWAGRGTGRVCLLDLDLQFGEVATALRLRPRFTIADALALRAGEEGELDDHLEEYLVDHETGVSVLVAPRDPAEADRIEPADVGRVIDLARRRFDVVVVDTPSALTEVVLTALDRSDVLYTLATLDTPSVRNLGVFLHTLERLRIPSDNVRLVLNKAERDVGIGVDQVARLYPQGFDMVLPYAREVTRSINVGMPVLTS